MMNDEITRVLKKYGRADVPTYLKELAFLRGLLAEASKMITGQVPRDEYIKANLADEMRKHRGKKRLRKKKAKRILRMRWGFLQIGRLLSRRINYSEIGRRLFTVEPLPDPVRPVYMNLDAMAGGEE